MFPKYLKTTSGLLILLHCIISLTDVTSYNEKILYGLISVSQNSPRLCHVIKETESQPYGFNFAKHQDGEYVLRVDANSAAETAGLKAGDRIIEVNGFNVEAETHDQILQRMRGLSTEMKLLVVDQETDLYYKSRGITIHSSMSAVRHLKSMPSQLGKCLLHLYHAQCC